MDQINLDMQTQMYVVAGVALASILISLCLLVLSGVLMVKMKRLTKMFEEQSERDMVDHQFQSPQIHPQEELGRRGFLKFPQVKAER